MHKFRTCLYFCSFMYLFQFSLFGVTQEPSFNIHYVNFNQVYDPVLSRNAIVRDERGFENDFLIIDTLIRRYEPKNLFEIGTCEGKGTKIIKNAMQSRPVLSLDLPPGEGPYQIPLAMIGAKCNLPYTQLFGDSMNYDYTQHFPIDCWFIDGWHDYVHVYYETIQALLSEPILILWHDTDIPEVFDGVIDALETDGRYELYRVVDTRMSYAIKAI